MSAYISLPLIFIHFWFIEAPLKILKRFGETNSTFFEVFSLALLIKTFFKPIKNEYREGLVGFSIGMGIFVKTILILLDLSLFALLLISEAAFLLLFLLLPFISLLILLQ